MGRFVAEVTPVKKRRRTAALSKGDRVITAVEGIRVGHWTDPVGRTGCTVVLCPPGTVGSGEVRGGAPGTRETDLLRPGMLVHEVNAILVTGGSAFGLAAADGVMRWLEERGIGFRTPAATVPIVPAAVLFDLSVGDPAARPGPDHGYAACEAASEEVTEGRVGAGTGATVAGQTADGGIGTASLAEEGLVVGALAAVNAFGEIIEDDGTVIAGGLTDDEIERARQGPMNTTIAVVATNARLSRERAHLLAIASHDGLARAVKPAHTMWDGDTVFTLATGIIEAQQPVLERMAEEAVADAIRRAVREQASPDRKESL
jgi:L-aminopeptidase/D-esterase-like protein